MKVRPEEVTPKPSVDPPRAQLTMSLMSPDSLASNQANLVAADHRNKNANQHLSKGGQKVKIYGGLLVGGFILSLILGLSKVGSPKSDLPTVYEESAPEAAYDAGLLPMHMFMVFKDDKDTTDRWVSKILAGKVIDDANTVIGDGTDTDPTEPGTDGGDTGETTDPV